jgi:hypothetical protein
MTKKHFIAVAAIINNRLAPPPSFDDLAQDGNNAAYNRALLGELAGDLARLFASENPNFDRARFLEA